MPVVLDVREVVGLIEKLEGTMRLAALVQYGAGLRRQELVSLRIKDVDVARGTITVRGGKGDKDRVTVLPNRLQEPLKRQMHGAVHANFGRSLNRHFWKSAHSADGKTSIASHRQRSTHQQHSCRQRLKLECSDFPFLLKLPPSTTNSHSLGRPRVNLTRMTLTALTALIGDHALIHPLHPWRGLRFSVKSAMNEVFFEQPFRFAA